jgi:hypothetical protein
VETSSSKIRSADQRRKHTKLRGSLSIFH